VRTFAATLLGLLSSASFISPVLAQSATPLRPPSHPIDPNCIHTVPNGARINAQTWEVTLNGATVATYPPCTSGASVAKPDNDGPSGGYYAQTVTPNESTTVSDDFGGTFVVPEYSNVSDNDGEYWSFWPGLIAYNWPSSGSNAVLQPTLNWYSDGTYFINSDLDFGSNGSYTQYNSGYLEAYASDEVESYIYQYESSPDAWEVASIDFTQGYSTAFEVYNIPSTYTKFTQAFVVLEGFNGSLLGPLPSCADLSPSGSVSYDILTFDRGTPPTYTPYTGPNLWTGSAGPPGTTSYPATGPECNWGYSVNTPTETLTFSQ
jgi:hypothetical protein